MFKKNHKKYIVSLLAFFYLIASFNISFAQDNASRIKVLTEKFSALKNVEIFRTNNYNKCQIGLIKYKELVADKKISEIFDAAKRDLAYEATQNALPESLRKEENYYISGLTDSKNFIKFHANNLCSNIFDLKYVYYGIIILFLVLLIKRIFK